MNVDILPTRWQHCTAISSSSAIQCHPFSPVDLQMTAEVYAFVVVFIAPKVFQLPQWAVPKAPATEIWRTFNLNVYIPGGK